MAMLFLDDQLNQYQLINLKAQPMNSLQQDRDRNSIRSLTYQQMNLLVRHSDVMPGLPFQHFQISEDAKTIIQKLMHSSIADKNKHSSSRKEIESNNTSEGLILLEATEIKIFNQVINLLDQIDSLKRQVAHQQAETARLREQRIHYSSRSNKQDKFPSVSELQIQRNLLKRKLKKIYARKNGGLHKMLRQEIQRYDSLKKQMYSCNNLTESNDQQIEIQAEKIRLKEANESLKIRIQLLRNTQSYKTSFDNQANKTQLSEHVSVEEQNKYAFLSDLDEFRRQYQELLDENKELLRKMKDKQEKKLQFSPKKYQRKLNQPNENIISQKSIQLSPFKLKTQNLNIQPYVSTQKTMQWRQKNGTASLGQYVDLLSQMKNILQN